MRGREGKEEESGKEGVRERTDASQAPAQPFQAREKARRSMHRVN